MTDEQERRRQIRARLLEAGCTLSTEVDSRQQCLTLGNNNARRHGRYSAESIAQRREIAAMFRDMKRLIEEVGD
jgi:hypothetical protein